MKKLAYLLLFSGLILITSIVYAQQQQPSIPTNPRVSSKPVYVKDTVPAQIKQVTKQDSIKQDLNKPIQGGLFAVSGILGFPQNDFGVQTNNTIGYGFDITLLANLLGKRSRAEWEQRVVNVYAGGNFQFMRQDGTSDNYTSENASSVTNITSKVRNNMSGIGLLTRVELFRGTIKLFAEAGLGSRVFGSNHHIEMENTPKGSTNPDDVITTTNTYKLRSSLIGNYSYGGGMRMCKNNIGIEFKFISVKGSAAEYVDVKSIQFDRTNNSVTYETKQSHTDIVIFQIGVSGRF